MKQVLLIGLILTLASCGVVRNTAGALGVGQASVKRGQLEVNGIRYRTRATATSDDKRSFEVTAGPIAPDPEMTKEAARYQANRYCLLTFGGSDKDWVIGPDTELEDIPNDGATMTLSGRCTQR